MYNGIGKSKPKLNKTSIVLMGISFVLSIVYLILNAVGFFEPKIKDKAFYFDDFSIVLNDTFTESELVSCDAVFLSDDVMICVTKEEFDGLTENCHIGMSNTAYEYANYVANANNKTDKAIEITREIINGKEYTYFTFTTEEEKSRTNRTYSYKTDDAFWIVQFITFSEEYDSLIGTIESYASSIEFE